MKTVLNLQVLIWSRMDNLRFSALYMYIILSLVYSYFFIIIVITSTSDLQPSTAILNLSPGKSVLNKFKPY